MVDLRVLRDGSRLGTSRRQPAPEPGRWKSGIRRDRAVHWRHPTFAGAPVEPAMHREIDSGRDPSRLYLLLAIVLGVAVLRAATGLPPDRPPRWFSVHVLFEAALIALSL